MMPRETTPLPLGKSAPDTEALVVAGRTPRHASRTSQPRQMRLASRVEPPFSGEERLRVGLRTQRTLLPLIIVGVRAGSIKSGTHAQVSAGRSPIPAEPVAICGAQSTQKMLKVMIASLTCFGRAVSRVSEQCRTLGPKHLGPNIGSNSDRRFGRITVRDTETGRSDREMTLV